MIRAAVIGTTLVGGTASAADPVTVPGPNPGMIDAFVHVPATLAEPPGLVVFLHGCEQGVPEIDANSGWTDAANELGFIVLYPSQRVTNHPLLCWNWYEPGDFGRDSGEAASIVALVGELVAQYGVDPNRIFVSGVSSGGFMATSLGGSYPDLFSGVSAMAGGPGACALGLSEGTGCMSGTSDRTGEEWAARLTDNNNYEEPPELEWPQMLVWQGADDPFVDPANADELVEQWSALIGVDTVPDVEIQAGNATSVAEYHDDAGDPRIVQLTVGAMGHGVAVDPAGGCGASTTPFYFDAGLCAAMESAIYFGLDLPPDPGGGTSGGEDDTGGDDTGTSGGDGSSDGPADDDDDDDDDDDGSSPTSGGDPASESDERIPTSGCQCGVGGQTTGLPWLMMLPPWIRRRR